MKYKYTIIYVENVKETIEFYQKVFGFQQKFLTTEADYGELFSGETTIAFASIDLVESTLKKGFLSRDGTEKPFGVEFSFTTDNIDEDFQKAIEMGAIEFEPVTEKPWGRKLDMYEIIMVL